MKTRESSLLGGNYTTISSNKRRWKETFKSFQPRRPIQLILFTLLIFTLGRLSRSIHLPLHERNKFIVPPGKFIQPPQWGSNGYPDPPPEIMRRISQPGKFSDEREGKGNKRGNGGQVVPKIIHYVYGLKPLPDQRMEEDGEGYLIPSSSSSSTSSSSSSSSSSSASTTDKKGEEFPYYAYLAVRSVLVNIKPDVIYFHHHNTPTGPWWDLLLPHLTLRQARVPTRIFGNKLDHFAHRSDVIRLEALLSTGGIYLDIDTYIIRPFDEFLFDPVTLGMESATDSRRSPLDPEGLCNGIIISQPHSSFLERWRASYEDFQGGRWAFHSVVKPWEIARRYPQELTVLNTRAFFWPGWWGEEVAKVHETDEWDFHKSGQYAYHAWESLAMKYLSKLDPRTIKASHTSFNKMVRPFIGPTDEKVHDKWIKEKNGSSL